MGVAGIDELVAFRRRLHAHPELSEAEHRTAEAIVERLAEAGPSPVVEGLGSMGTGVCAVYEGAESGPTILIRAELDALPIQETCTFEHRSSVDGVSHKCGHDGHMTTLIAVADGLRARPIDGGRVLLLFQPAEETGTGAAAVIEDPEFRALGSPDYVYAFHNVPGYPLGHVLVREGSFAQASVGFIVRFRGRTSHSSYPEHGVNPSRAVTELVTAVNAFDATLAGRTTGPVLGTVSYAEIGSAARGPNFGTAPGEAMVMGVVRGNATEDLEFVRGELARQAGELAAKSGLGMSLSWHEAFAATEAHPDCVATVRAAAGDAGLEVEELDRPFRWSEDFGCFTKVFRGAFFGLGSGVDQPQLHDEGYDYPDALIEIGARLYRAVIDRQLGLDRLR